MGDMPKVTQSKPLPTGPSAGQPPVNWNVTLSLEMKRLTGAVGVPTVLKRTRTRSMAGVVGPTCTNLSEATW